MPLRIRRCARLLSRCHAARWQDGTPGRRGRRPGCGVDCMKQWTAKAERGSACLIQLIAWLARVVGRPLCRALLYPIVLYFVITDATARRGSAEFLTAVRGQPARLRDVFAHIHSFAATLLD